VIVNPYYSQDIHGPYELHGIGDFALEDGGLIPNCQLAVSTFGKLNAAKDNAILITTWYSGTSKIMSDVYVGKGRALDPDKYFIVIVNQIGNGLSTSPHNSNGPIGMARFPKVRIADDVRAQHKLLTETFGIASLALVTGGSMGAQQTYEWAVAYPDMVRRAAPIAGTARTTDHDFLFADAVRDTLLSDPRFKDGNYAESSDVAAGLRAQAKLWSVMGWSPEFYVQQRPKALGFETIDAFMDGFMNGYFGPMDPNDLLCMSWKWQRADVSRHTGGDLAAALGRVKAKTFVMPNETDMFFPPVDCAREAALIPGGELRVLKTIDGHLGLFGTDADYVRQVDDNLAELLAIPA
jgi:homoserine O-acetyltransferase/O-succinyltransferase